MNLAKRRAQIAVDILMAAVILVQMSYSLAGELLHEITGITFFGLCILHHVLAKNFSKALYKGKKSSDKIIKLIVDILLTAIVLAMMFSALPISKYVFAFLGLSNFASVGRTVHLLGAYWGFALIGLHIGFNFDVMFAKPMKDKKKRIAIIAAMLLLSALGLYFFISEGIYKYMLLMNQFVFFDTDGGLPLHLLKYICIQILFISVGYGLINASKKKTKIDN